MSHDEQQSQHESIKNIEKKSYQITRGQLVTWGLILLSAGFSARKITSSVATKDDIQILSNKLDVLTKKQDAGSFAFNEYKREDSIDKINIKTDLKADILATNRTVRSIQIKCENIFKQVSFVSEHRDRNGKTIVIRAVQ
jgi:hypothetical protein